MPSDDRADNVSPIANQLAEGAGAILMAREKWRTSTTRRGNAGYSSINAYVDDASLEHIENVIDAGLDIFVAAWQVVVGGKVAP